MPLLSSSEAVHVSDSFMFALYGEELFNKWKTVKEEMQFVTEREFVAWLLDIVDHYKHATEGKVKGAAGSSYKELRTKNVKPCSYEEPSAAAIAALFNTGSDTATSTAGAGRVGGDAGGHVETSAISHLERTQFNDKLQEISDNIHARSEKIYAATDGQCFEEEVNFENYYSKVQSDILEKKTHSSVINKKAGHTKYNCSYCSYSSRNTSNVRNHIREVHEQLKPFLCHLCQYACARRTQLRAHLVWKHGYKSKHACDACGRCYPFRRNLQLHAKSCKGTDGKDANMSLLKMY